MTGYLDPADARTPNDAPVGIGAFDKPVTAGNVRRTAIERVIHDFVLRQLVRNSKNPAKLYALLDGKRAML